MNVLLLVVHFFFLVAFEDYEKKLKFFLAVLGAKIKTLSEPDEIQPVCREFCLFLFVFYRVLFCHKNMFKTKIDLYMVPNFFIIS